MVTFKLLSLNVCKIKESVSMAKKTNKTTQRTPVHFKASLGSCFKVKELNL